jgi:hypothetical protein
MYRVPPADGRWALHKGSNAPAHAARSAGVYNHNQECVGVSASTIHDYATKHAAAVTAAYSVSNAVHLQQSLITVATTDYCIIASITKQAHVLSYCSL